MANVNYTIQEKAHLALCVIFIVSIAAANCLLVISLVRQRGSILVVRSTILLSLAVGDVILALFSLVVDLVGEDKLRCNTPFFSKIYRDYLLQFVYSVGLIMLALYLMVVYKGHQQRQQQQQQQQLEQQQLMIGFNGVESAGPGLGTERESREGKASRIGLALICSGAPWLVALVVILPLTAPRLSECSPHTSASREIMYLWACVVLPATLALVAAGGTAAILKPSPHQSPAGGAEFLPATEHGESVPLRASLDHGGGLHAAVVAASDGDDGCTYGKVDADTTVQVQDPQCISAPTLYPNPVSASENPAANTWADNSQGPYTSGSPAPYYPLPAGLLASDQRAILNFEREKSALLAVAVVHFVCVIPNAVFVLTFANNPDLHGHMDFLTFAVLSQLCKWMAVLRSVLAPLCWIAFLRN